MFNGVTTENLTKFRRFPFNNALETKEIFNFHMIAIEF